MTFAFMIPTITILSWIYWTRTCSIQNFLSPLKFGVAQTLNQYVLGISRWRNPRQLVTMVRDYIYMFALSICKDLKRKLIFDTGIDPKSLVLNLASSMLFFMPILMYLKMEYFVPYVQATVGVFALAFIVPPVGWLRPHPYSDLPGNKPIGYRD